MSYNRTKPAFAPGGVLGISGISITEDCRYRGNGGGTTFASKWHPRIPQTWRGVDRATDAHLLSSRITLQRFAIVDVDTVNKYFYVSGDQREYFPQYKNFSIRGSTGNDYEGIGIYHNPYKNTVAASYDSGTDRTKLTVSVTPASAVADGYIYTGLFVVRPGTYSLSVRGFARGDSTNGGAYRLNKWGSDIVYDSNGCYSSGGSPGESGLNQYTGNNTVLGDYLISFDEILVVSTESVYELQQYAVRAFANYGLGTTLGGGGTTYGITSRSLSITWQCIA